MKKLNEQEIERLFRFTREHFVEHYDLQAELADHLANAIEAQWEQNPAIPFETALQAEFRKFGVFGFMDVVEKRQAALSKKYYRLLWGYCKKFFQLPVVLGSIAAVVAVKFLLQWSYWVLLTIALSLVIITSVRLYRLRKSYNRKIKETGRRWLLEDIIYSVGGMSVLINVPVQFTIHYDVVPQGFQLWIISAFVVLFIMYDYVALWVIPSEAEKHLQDTYPEYRLQVAGK